MCSYFRIKLGVDPQQVEQMSIKILPFLQLDLLQIILCQTTSVVVGKVCLFNWEVVWELMCNILESGEIDFDIIPTTVLIYILLSPAACWWSHFFLYGFLLSFSSFLLELYHHLMSPNHLKLNAVCCFQ
jgi:hypothetical protein